MDGPHRIIISPEGAVLAMETMEASVVRLNITLGQLPQTDLVMEAKDAALDIESLLTYLAIAMMRATEGEQLDG